MLPPPQPVCSSSAEIRSDEDSEAFSLGKQDQLRSWRDGNMYSQMDRWPLKMLQSVPCKASKFQSVPSEGRL
ncbi:hypothetical protein STEG23_003109, partial [Scotinomys teguina]